MLILSEISPNEMFTVEYNESSDFSFGISTD